MTIIRTARGDKVDIDMHRIKQQMASNPEPSNVKDRRETIERRMKRRVKKAPVHPGNVPPVAQQINEAVEAIEEAIEAVDDVDQSDETPTKQLPKRIHKNTKKDQ